MSGPPDDVKRFGAGVGRGEERGTHEVQRVDDDPETLAALAAVEGRSLLHESDSVDDRLIDELELAAGALYAAMSLAQGASGFDRVRSAGSAVPRGGAEGGRGTAAEPSREALARIERTLLLRCSPSAQEGGLTESAARPGVSTGADAGAPRTAEPPASPRLDRALPAPSAAPSRPSWGLLSGWATAAALLISLVVLQWRGEGSGDPSERRASLLASAADAAVVEWSKEFGGFVSGDVAWSDERNEGYMRFSGLAPNDPSVSQYQLWIFRGSDPDQEPHPVDGGVFDVQADGEVVVPIDAKIGVGRAGLFAVTVENPGGVVVSDREQIVAVAPRP